MTWRRRSTSTAPRSASRWRRAKFTRSRAYGRPCCWSRRSIRGRARCRAASPTCELPPGRPRARHPGPDLRAAEGEAGPGRARFWPGGRALGGAGGLSGRGFLYPAAGAARAGFAGREVPGPARGRDSSHRVRRHRRPRRARRDQRNRNPARRRRPRTAHGRLDRVPSSGGSGRGADGTGGASQRIRGRILGHDHPATAHDRNAAGPARTVPDPARPGSVAAVARAVPGGAETAADYGHSHLRRTAGHHSVILSEGRKYPICRADIRYISVMMPAAEAGRWPADLAAGSPKEPTMTSRRQSSLPATR